MLILSMNPGHDGAIAVIDGRRLSVVLEAEKDSFPRFERLTPTAVLDLASTIGRMPDIVCLGGWRKDKELGLGYIGAGYRGLSAPSRRIGEFFGKPLEVFTSSHERSHIMTALGMAKRDEHRRRSVLVWEGALGGFYVVEGSHQIVRELPVLSQPGARFAFLYALADPTFPDAGQYPRGEDSGKLMALAAYGRDDAPTDRIRDTVRQILRLTTVYPAPKGAFRKSVLHNVGVESDVTKIAAALLADELFNRFASVATKALPKNEPLHISGGCGLNCEWNSRWAALGYFSSVFVPPCPNDSGSAIGTALDALATVTGDPHIEWDVYCGGEFVHDSVPDPLVWVPTPLSAVDLAAAIHAGRIVAWVQGRSELGPRALGHRSLLAHPFSTTIRDRLNHIKQREPYRPIAPCCRIEDLGRAFIEDFSDPYMLYVRHVRPEQKLMGVTHIDGTARVQSVTEQSCPDLHELLSACSARTGVGVLSNTSLNFKGRGFINRMSDLLAFCAARGVDDMVVGRTWYSRRSH